MDLSGPGIDIKLKEKKRKKSFNWRDCAKKRN
jgi:hypothetical protein